jgi:predicted alpha/beta superfamily hydrolase
MKNILLPVLLLSFVSARSQYSSNEIAIGKADTIYSRILGEKRNIWISLPPGYYSGESVKYPVVYLLDGDNHFASVVSMIRQLSEGYTSFLPKMIVVAILNTDRLRDLTPSHISRKADDGTEIDSYKSTGGGDKFLSFINQELIPHIDSAFPTSPYKMFIGHSLGGLMVIDALLNHSEMFNAYVAIDPSLWYDDTKLLKQSADLLQKKNFPNKSLYVAIANTMKPSMDTMSVRKDNSENTSHIRAILDFTTILKAAKTNGLKWEYKYYADDDHGSVPFIAEYDALRFIFRNYRLPDWDVLTDSSFNTEFAIKQHYNNISKEWGYKVLPPEPFVNSLGYFFMGKKNFEKAIVFFQMNIDNYPASANAYDSMGDLWIEKNDKAKALQYFNRSLSIKESPATRAKLEKLKEKK